MEVKDFFTKTGLIESEVSFFYKNRTDDRPEEVKVVQSSKNGEWEIIRESQIKGRIEYAGFFTTYSTLWIKTPLRFLQIGKLLQELPRRIKQRQDCYTVQEIKDFLLLYFNLYDRYENRNFGKQKKWSLVYKDNRNHTNINVKLIWYNNEDLVTEIYLEWYKGWRDEEQKYKIFEWTFKNDDYNDECWHLYNSQGSLEIIKDCDILTEISNFIIEFEPNLPLALLRDSKLKQLLEL